MCRLIIFTFLCPSNDIKVYVNDQVPKGNQHGQHSTAHPGPLATVLDAWAPDLLELRPLQPLTEQLTSLSGTLSLDQPGTAGYPVKSLSSPIDYEDTINRVIRYHHSVVYVSEANFDHVSAATARSLEVRRESTFSRAVTLFIPENQN